MVELTNEQKLALLNTLDVVDYSASGDELEYVTVEYNDETRKVFELIGISDEEVKSYMNDYFTDEPPTVDIVGIAYKLGAKWFDENGWRLDSPTIVKVTYEVTYHVWRDMGDLDVHGFVYGQERKIDDMPDVWNVCAMKWEKVGE